MRVSELIRTALRSLRANKKRSFLTIIGIMIGIAAVITILGIGDGITQTMYDKFGNNAKRGQQTTEIYYTPDNENSAVNGFNQQDLTNIDNQFGGTVRRVRIEHETANLNTHAEIGDTLKHTTVSLLKKPTTDVKMIAGHNLSASQLATGESVALMKESLAKKQYGTAQNAIGTTATVGSTSYRVVGVYRGQAEYSTDGDENKYGVDLLLPKSLYYQGDTASQGNTIKLTFDQGENAGRLSRKVEKYLKKNGSAASQGTYTYEDMEKALKQFSSQMSIITSFISLIAAISLFIAGIGVMNMMYISVSERTQEIGIRLAVGATPANIMMQFLIEAVVLTVTGGLLGFLGGAGLAHLIAPLLSHSIGSGIHIHAHITLNAFLLAFGTSAAVGLIFGILPARQAANKNLIDILR
ncbi:ABC transporter permease [Limosilactobacillus sp.]|jgi:putative ABC transport system permease protein|uniref:ABC transporter permease n=1 Tax=Limosilactobacillus sp. TaxID=2773925 RepID=UPI0025B80056|nr:ABC transporter permease [Limosilactobacillus sp.]MCH3921516.1 ABC transporter permease [Limosilactobacillus sp.]MCH3928287.1 ABC transporter permease [Limosilactobacillus sp.]